MNADARTFTKRTDLPVPAETLWDWHLRPGAFERLTPPWTRVKMLDVDRPLTEGSRAAFKVKTGPIWRRWTAEHRNLEPGRAFTDVQVSGPFRSWSHRHRFEPRGADASTLEDAVEYRLPFGGWLGAGMIESQIARMFDYRHDVTAADLAAHAAYADAPRRVVAISGASGLVGSALAAFLTTGGHDVRRLVRNEPRDDGDVFWNPHSGEVDTAGLAGVDAVIHLAGENIAGGRWTDERKARIRDSRVNGTRLLADAVATLDPKPECFLSASAIGYYGARGDEALTEDAAPGTGFLADVCRAWEAAAEPAWAAGIRTAALRLGVVLSPRGGALGKMLTPFRMGVGGRLGDGRQVLSWVGLDDVVGAFHHALMTPSVAGPVNVTAPSPETNRAFTKALGIVLRRPTVLPVPGAVLRTLVGEMADPLLLTGCRAVPHALETSGYRFRHPDLIPCLRYLLGARLDPGRREA